MPRLFGTDGVRGLANRDLTATLALDLAVAAARVFALRSRSDRTFAVVGRDSRASGEFLEAAVCAGLASAGVDVFRVGVLPTPAVAFLTGHLDADFGVMLSASHNPMPDNGIKFFAAGGEKLDDAIEDEIEAMMLSPFDAPVGGDVGRIRDLGDAAAMYLEHLSRATTTSLAGLKLVVDCANGAASHVAGEAYRNAGAHVIALHAHPDGLNINDKCGSTHMENLIASVRENGADLGLAHDGDADRCLAVDADGNIVDGDQILAILALSLKTQGKLTHNTVVGTVMANLGFKIAMREHDIAFVETAVGDRYVLEEMREHGYALGGEQSGHVIVSEFATTGDGILTGLLLADRMAVTGESLADLARVVQKLPQVLINVGGVDKVAAMDSDVVAAAVALATDELGDSGRVLLRPSGTENLVRVMVEAPTAEQAQAVADRLATVVKETASL